MNVVWSLLTGVVLICIQVAALWCVCRKHRREMAVQVGIMAMLTAAIQPREIRAHCRRVADVSEKIAQEMRLPVKRLALVHAVGILHEIDGIGGITMNVPLESAILSVADYFDRITHDDCGSMSKDDAIEQIRREVGTHFDPAVVKALMNVAVRSADVEQREVKE